MRLFFLFGKALRAGKAKHEASGLFFTEKSEETLEKSVYFRRKTWYTTSNSFAVATAVFRIPAAQRDALTRFGVACVRRGRPTRLPPDALPVLS